MPSKSKTIEPKFMTVVTLSHDEYAVIADHLRKNAAWFQATHHCLYAQLYVPLMKKFGLDAWGKISE